MPKKRILLKEKFLLSFIAVILTSLFLSVSFSYSLFIFNVNKKLDPQVVEASQIILDRIGDVKERSLVYSDILSKNKELLPLFNEDSPKEEAIDTARWMLGKTGLDLLQVIDINGKVLLRAENILQRGDIKRDVRIVEKALSGVRISSVEKIDDKYAFVAASPVYENNNLKGVLIVGFVASDQLLSKLESSLDEKITIFNEKGEIISTNIKDETGIVIKEQKITKGIYEKVALEGKGITDQVDLGRERFKVLYTPLSNQEGRTSAILMTAISLNPIISNNTSTIITIIISNIITIAVAYILATISSRKIVDPILTIKKGTEIVASGNLDYKIIVDTNDESFDLANSFNGMTEKMKELISQVSDENSKLLAERNKFSIVLEGVLDGIFTLDYQRRITLFNKAAQELTGLTEADVIGKRCDEVLIIFRNKVRLPSSDFCPLMPIDKDQIVFADKNLKLVSAKKELYISMTSAVIKNGKLTDLGCIVTFRDSTKEREAEELKLDFVSMAAHELRTPLTSIRGYLSLFEETVRQKITEEEVKYLERVAISSNQLSTLVENLLDVAKIEHNTLEMEIKKENWMDIIYSTAETFKTLAEQKKIKLEIIEPKKPIPDVAVDRLRIAEVLSNLIANALNYTNSGGTVEVGSQVKDDFAETYVKDTGVGIPERSLNHLFTKFYRVSGALEQGSKGTGLGLFISKSIVNMHKGEIWAESKVNAGSKFTFTVPLYKG